MVEIDFSINEFETCVYGGKPEQATNMLMTIFSYFQIHGTLYDKKLNEQTAMPGKISVKGLAPLSQSPLLSGRVEIYTRLASAITALWSNKHYPWNDLNIGRALYYKQVLRKLFLVTSYGDMKHILINLEILSPEYQIIRTDPTALNLLLVCETLEGRLALDFSSLYPYSKKMVTSAMVSLLICADHVFTQSSEDRVTRIRATLDSFNDAELEPIFLDRLAPAWMYCTYFSDPKSHDIKIFLNKIIRRWLDRDLADSRYSHGKTLYQKGRTKRPLMIVANERYHASHSMYRCYHPYIKRLAQDYDLIAISESKHSDHLAEEDFLKTIYVEANSVNSVKQLVKNIQQLKPDVLFFPSLGMSMWAIALANLRLAKHQMMGAGHPASSFCPDMDYMMLAGTKGDAAEYQPYCSEKVLKVANRNGTRTAHNQLDLSRLPQRQFDGTVRIAINSVIIKLKSDFIATCNQIERQSKTPVELHFFLGTPDGLATDSPTRQLGACVRNCVIHSVASYAYYMKKLALCDLALGTFPFGGTNSNADLALLHIPKVMRTQTPPYNISEVCDEGLWREFDIPEFLYCATQEEYVNSAIKMIDDRELRESISQNIKQQNPNKVLFETTENTDVDELCQLVQNTLHPELNHKCLQTG